jgi:hypothetical protein
MHSNQPDFYLTFTDPWIRNSAIVCGRRTGSGRAGLNPHWVQILFKVAS